MNSIVIELQKDILDANKKTSDLLRKAYIISKKLKIKKFESWINHELNGYKNQKDIPTYRKISGQLRAWNPYNGWIPVIVTNKKTQENLSSRMVFQSIPELEDLLNREKSGRLTMSLPDEFSNLLEFQSKVRLDISSSQIARIIEKVKNIILEWSLKLEGDGILGDKMKFNNDELKKANEMNYTVNNFYGDFSKSQFVQNSPESNLHYYEANADIDKLLQLFLLIKENIHGLDLSKHDRKALEDCVEEGEKSLKEGEIGLVYETLKTIRNILEGMTGSLLASGLLYKLKELF